MVLNAEASVRSVLAEGEYLRYIRLMAERDEDRRAAEARKNEPHARHGYANIQCCYYNGYLWRPERGMYERYDGIEEPTAEAHAVYLQMKADG
jgi:hypothetical protein